MKFHLTKLFWIGYVKTAYLNFKLLPFRQAIKFPIILTQYTTLGSLSGRIIIKGKCQFANIRFGILHSDLVSWKDQRTFINISGTLIVNGWVQFGVGCKVVVDKEAILEIGDNICFGSNNKIVCRHSITIGNNFRSAWDVQILDTNFHYTKEIKTGKVVKRTKPVLIGNNNWIGNRSTISPGTVTPNFFIAASNSLCNKDYAKLMSEYSLVAGSPAKLIKTDIYRILDREESEINSLFNDTAESFILTDKTVRSR